MLAGRGRGGVGVLLAVCVWSSPRWPVPSSQYIQNEGQKFSMQAGLAPRGRTRVGPQCAKRAGPRVRACCPGVSTTAPPRDLGSAGGSSPYAHGARRPGAAHGAAELSTEPDARCARVHVNPGNCPRPRRPLHGTGQPVLERSWTVPPVRCGPGAAVLASHLQLRPCMAPEKIRPGRAMSQIRGPFPYVTRGLVLGDNGRGSVGCACWWVFA